MPIKNPFFRWKKGFFIILPSDNRHNLIFNSLITDTFNLTTISIRFLPGLMRMPMGISVYDTWKRGLSPFPGISNQHSDSARSRNLKTVLPSSSFIRTNPGGSQSLGLHALPGFMKRISPTFSLTLLWECP